MSKMFEVKTAMSCIRTIKEGDPKWVISNGFYCSPRAGFEFGKECPESYKSIVIEMLRNGWLKPVAYMKDNEVMWETLSE